MKFSVFIVACICCLSAFSSGAHAAATYSGRVLSVAVGFQGGVGVGLQKGSNCNGLPYALLTTSNPQFEAISQLLILAANSGSEVQFAQLGSVIDSEKSGACVITEASLGYFPGY